MTKYNQQFKQQVIQFYLQYKKNQALTRQHFGLEKSILRLWIAQYQHSGNAALAVLTRKRYYSPEFKLLVTQSLMARKVSLRQASLKFGITSASLVSHWLKAFKN